MGGADRSVTHRELREMSIDELYSLKRELHAEKVQANVIISQGREKYEKASQDEYIVTTEIVRRQDL